MTEEAEKKRLSGWWVLITLGVGLAVAILFGQFSSAGSAEIAGIMAGMSAFCVRAFWDFRIKTWYFPLCAVWASMHLLILFLFVMPMKLAPSKGFILLVWAEFSLFVCLIFLASRVWGGLPEKETSPGDF